MDLFPKRTPYSEYRHCNDNGSPFLSTYEGTGNCKLKYDAIRNKIVHEGRKTSALDLKDTGEENRGFGVFRLCAQGSRGSAAFEPTLANTKPLKRSEFSAERKVVPATLFSIYY